MKEAVVDMGMIRSTKGSRIYAAVKGVIDAGIKINCAEEMLPEIKDVDDIKSKIIGGK